MKEKTDCTSGYKIDRGLDRYVKQGGNLTLIISFRKTFDFHSKIDMRYEK